MSHRSRILLLVTIVAPLGWICATYPAVAATAAEQAAEGSYRVGRVIHVGGQGRWDYVVADPAARRLYVPRQTHTQILNLDSGEVLGDLADTAGVHGVALAPELDRGFTSNGAANTVTVFELKSLKPLGTIPTGANPDAICYDPTTKRVFAFNGKGRNATVIDATAAPAVAAVLAQVPLGAKPEFFASDGQGRLFVNLEDTNSIAVIDAKAMKVVDTWKIDGGEEPSGLAIDAAHHRLFAGCGGNNVMAIIDSQSGKTLATVPIGKGVDACEFDPGTGEAFASCGDGTLTVVKETQPGKFEKTQTAQTRPGARTMTLDPTTHTVYLPTAEFDPTTVGQRRPTAKPDSFMIVVVTRSK